MNRSNSNVIYSNDENNKYLHLHENKECMVLHNTLLHNIIILIIFNILYVLCTPFQLKYFRRQKGVALKTAFQPQAQGAWISFPPPPFSLLPPPLFSKFSYKSFLFQNFHNHSFFLHLTISVDVIHHE